MDDLNDLAQAATSSVTQTSKRSSLMLAEPTERLAAACIDLFAITISTMLLFAFGETSGKALLWIGEAWLLAHLVVEMVTGYTLGTRLVKVRVVDRDGQPVSTARLVVRGFVRHLWLWVLLIGSTLALMSDSGWISAEMSFTELFHWAIGLAWLMMCGGSFAMLGDASQTLADRLTGTFVTSDRRKLLAELRAKQYGL